LIRFGQKFRKIPLALGQYALVDIEDYERVSKNKSKPGPAKTSNTYYATRTVTTAGQKN